MKRLPYPPDGGLKAQVRDPKDCLSVFTVLDEEYKRMKREAERKRLEQGDADAADRAKD